MGLTAREIERVMKTARKVDPAASFKVDTEGTIHILPGQQMAASETGVVDSYDLIDMEVK